VIRPDRHATDEQLADLSAGALSHRKATRITAHLTGCERCGQVSRKLAEMPALLASVQFPPMPATISIQIEAALRVESTQRLTAMPATEGGRGNLPARHSRRAARRSWHLPGLSVTATRLVAAAGALVIVAAGSYELASHAARGPTASSVEGSAAGPASVQQMSLGPDVTYGRPGALHTIHAIQSSANFLPAKLTTQVADAVHAARARGVSASQPAFSTPGASRAQGSSAGVSAAPSSGTASRLADCINLIAPGRIVLLVDLARYDGSPATIIVIAALGASPAEAWIVGSGCPASGKDVLNHLVLSHL
jgi:hypothetical protein